MLVRVAGVAAVFSLGLMGCGMSPKCSNGADDCVSGVCGADGYCVAAAASSSTSSSGGSSSGTASQSSSGLAMPGALVTADATKLTTEAGGSFQVHVVLATQPTAAVTVPLHLDVMNEAALSSSVLEFTPENWNVPQDVTITGLDDAVADGDAHLTLTLDDMASGDTNYNAHVPLPSSVFFTNQDDEVAKLLFDGPSPFTLVEGSQAAQFTVRLNSQPNGIVKLNLAVRADTTGNPASTQASVGMPLLQFDDVTWSTPQAVTVTAANDSIAEPDQGLLVAFSRVTNIPGGDTTYGNAGVVLEPFHVLLKDDETAAILVAPTSGLTTSEAFGQAQFSVVLGSQPLGDVHLTPSIMHPEFVTAEPALGLTFTPQDWNVPQVVVLTGKDVVGTAAQPQLATVTMVPGAMDLDPAYNAITVPAVTVLNVDDDAAAVLVEVQGMATATEGGGTQPSLEVGLSVVDSAQVTVTLTVPAPARLQFSPSVLTFPAGTKGPQTVMVSVVDDQVAMGNANVGVVAAASGGSGLYTGIMGQASLSVVDDDNAGVVVVQPVTPTGTQLITEDTSQHAVTFTVVLTSQPQTDVTVTPTSTNMAEAVASPPMLVFTAANWNMPQTVTVTAVDDLVDDGNSNLDITGAVTSSDAAYQGLPVQVVHVAVGDDDVSGLKISRATGSPGYTSELGNSGPQPVYKVSLTSKPTADVTVAVGVSDGTEATVNHAVLTFAPDAWDIPQETTITGRADSILDGDQDYDVTFTATSMDALYNVLPQRAYSLSNLGNRCLAITPAATTGTNVGGIAGADAKCRAAYPGSVAFIAGSTRDPSNSRTWVLRPSILYGVCGDRGAFSSVVETDADGVPTRVLHAAAAAATAVWTGLELSGTAVVMGANCGDWTSSGTLATGGYGDANSNTMTAVARGTGLCATKSAFLYCVDPP